MTKQSVSIWEFLFGGDMLTLIFSTLLLFAGIVSIVIFVKKLMFLNKQNQVDPYLLKNVNDLLNDGRIQAAVDFCRRDNSPESRSIEKGLTRLGRPVAEISNAMETHAQIEVNDAEKNLNFIATISGAAPMLGLLIGLLSLAISFSGISKSTELVTQDVVANYMFKALSPAFIGLFVGFISYIFHNVLVAKIDFMLMKIQYHTNEFLDIINRPA